MKALPMMILTAALVVGGTTNAAMVRVPADAATIQAGLDLAAQGDTIVVDDGIYYESRLARLAGKTLLGNPAAPDLVVLDASLTGGGFFGFGDSENNLDATIAGVTLRNSPINAISILRYRTLLLEDCVFVGNNSALHLLYGGARATRCRFEGNTGQTGGAIYAGLSGLQMLHCSFVGNTASTGGGAVFCGDSSYAFEECLFEDNSAPEGGALQMVDFAFRSTVELNSCTVRNNQAGSGGAAHLAGGGGMGCYLNAFNTDFRGNQASAYSEGYLADSGCHVTLNCCLTDLEGWGGSANVVVDETGCEGVVGDESATWSEVKALFR